MSKKPDPLFIKISGEDKISHLVISQKTGVKDDLILKFLQTKTKEFEANGELFFEITRFEENDEFQETTVAYLNLDQLHLLLRYLKKSEKIIKFIQEIQHLSREQPIPEVTLKTYIIAAGAFLALGALCVI